MKAINSVKVKIIANICLLSGMSWKANVVLLALSFFGVGSLVYLLYKRDEEKEIQDCLKLKTSRCTVIEVKIPADSVGLVIGRGGSTIKEIQLKSDTRINFKDEKASDEYRVCIIRGTAEAAQYAESLIHEVIVSQPFIETFEMMVPVIAIGRIIGKNGENIRQISRNSNAKITIENATISQGATERKITIKGTPEQIASGKVLIEQKVDEDFEFRKKIERNLANRSPRHKPKALMPGKADDEEAVKTFDHKERLVATGSDGLFEVYTSALESPDKLWVQMKGPCTAELDILNDQMTEYYSRKENREIHVLTEVSFIIIKKKVLRINNTCQQCP